MKLFYSKACDHLLIVLNEELLEKVDPPWEKGWEYMGIGVLEESITSDRLLAIEISDASRKLPEALLNSAEQVE